MLALTRWEEDPAMRRRPDARRQPAMPGRSGSRRPRPFAPARSARSPAGAGAALALLAALGAHPAAAQTASTVLDLDPSIRAAGAGGASNAVFWGGDPDIWANPALLGYARGLRYDQGRTQW